MGLEVAQYIPELNSNWPLGVDAVNLGDNHIRTVKLAVQGSFPGFVGTMATPKFVTLTEDELNALIDAALKAQAATIAGLWNFTTPPTINGDVIGTEAFATAADLVLQNLVQRPSNRSISANSAAAQNDQGSVIECTAALTLDLPTLAEGTGITIKNLTGGIVSLTLTGTTLSWQQGGAVATGPRTIAVNSVVQLHWRTGSNIDLWGNGIS